MACDIMNINSIHNDTAVILSHQMLKEVSVIIIGGVLTDNMKC